MRIIETIHPALQYRTFTCDKVISNVRISDLSSFYGEKPTEEAQKLYNQLKDIPLLEKDISVDKYSISVKIEEAFENNEQDWKNVRGAVFYCLANFFKVDLSEIEAAHTIKDDREKYSEPTVDIQAIYNIVSKVKIPHDFETHRAAWRGAIQDKVNILSDQTYPDPDGQLLYWQNELEKFDKAFDDLLALKLPTDA
jgi:hypothetical protein